MRGRSGDTVPDESNSGVLMKVIQAPQNFVHAGQLPDGLVGDDLRIGVADDIAVDLRYSRFVRPQAALWCVIYCALAARHGRSCELVVPEDVGVARYLKGIGLFDELKERGVKVDDRDIVPSGGQTKLQCFSSEDDVDRIANEALENLAASSLGAANLRPLVVKAFAELAQNGVEHSNSPVGCYGLIQYYDWQEGPRFFCVVADGGIGIRASLERNSSLRERIFYDYTAIELAMQERISGTGVSTRGVGLFAVAEDMRRPGREGDPLRSRGCKADARVGNRRAQGTAISGNARIRFPKDMM